MLLLEAQPLELYVVFLGCDVVLQSFGAVILKLNENILVGGDFLVYTFISMDKYLNSIFKDVVF